MLNKFEKLANENIRFLQSQKKDKKLNLKLVN